MKKSMRRTVITVLTFLMLMLMSTSAYAAKISAKSAVVGVGATTTLKVKGTKKKVKWSSSNKKVATVSKKGVVKGKKIGNARITAKVGKKKYTCSVSVKENVAYFEPSTNESSGKLGTIPVKVYYRNGKLVMQSIVINRTNKNVSLMYNYQWKLYLGTNEKNRKLAATASNQWMRVKLPARFYDGYYDITLTPAGKGVLNLAAMNFYRVDEKGDFY